MREIEHDKEHVWMRSSIVEEEAVDHERRIGTVPATNDEILVRVAQRVDYDLLADPTESRVSAPRITVGGMFEITASRRGISLNTSSKQPTSSSHWPVPRNGRDWSPRTDQIPSSEVLG